MNWAELEESLRHQELTTEELEFRIRTIRDLEGLTGRSEDLITLDRMNFIGGLRAQGHQIPRTRGRYRITGFVEPEPQTTPDQWPEEQQEILRWVETLQPVDHSFQSVGRLQAHLLDMHAVSGYVSCQQFSTAYILAYELAKDKGWFLDDGTIIARRFENQPRWRILTPTWGHELKDTMEKIGRISRRDVWMTGGIAGYDYAKNYPGVKKSGTRVQAVYRLDTLGDFEHMLKQVPSRKASYLRRNLKELRVIKADSGELTPETWVKLAKQVITTWKEGPAGLKQRQLAITRDYVAVDLVYPYLQRYSYLFMRGDQPAAVMVFDSISREYIADIASKGLNYPSLPGGYHSTGTAAIMLMAQDLLRQGFLYYQAGGIDGGTVGLEEYKLHLIEQTQTPPDRATITTRDWYLPGSKFGG